jgi:2-keto-4-pentenoate hydratase/2-oxohepta-3-ene-1,7-dioic acid hydratase in catechol pathway
MRLYLFDDYRLGVGNGDDNLSDITHLVDDDVAPGNRMSTLITNWTVVKSAALEASRGWAEYALSDVILREPQPRPPTTVAAPINCRRHQAEMGGASGVYPDPEIKSIATYAGFVKASTSVVGPAGAITLPHHHRRIDHEADVGIVIGKTTSCVSSADTMDYVFGYVPLLNITVHGDDDRSYRKSFDTFTIVGPAIFTADEVADPAANDLPLDVNGRRREQSNTKHLVYDIPSLVERYTAEMTLHPGDIIATGTPEGVGTLSPGDSLDLVVLGTGKLTMSVRSCS